MRKIRLLSLTLFGLGVLLFSISHSLPLSKLTPSAPSTAVVPSREQAIRYESHILPQSVVHTLLIPVQKQFALVPVVAEALAPIENFAQKYGAIAVLNGGFFDPKNQKTTSNIVQQGKLVADPNQNERLMHNPDNAPYLELILNRTEFRHYLCGQTTRYDIALHKAPPLAGCQLVDAIGGGPRLLPEMTAVQEGFLDYANGKVIHDALGSNQPNARTAIGITRDGSIVWVMVAQKQEAPITSGMSLPALAEFMKTLGVEQAMNLDGGSSSSLYYQGRIFYGRVNKQGNWVKRPVKSVLLVQENSGESQ